VLTPIAVIDDGIGGTFTSLITYHAIRSCNSPAGRGGRGRLGCGEISSGGFPEWDSFMTRLSKLRSGAAGWETGFRAKGGAKVLHRRRKGWPN
jgi:hypothetical protein